MNETADAETMAKAVQAVLSDSRLQTNWPEPKPPEPPSPPAQTPEWLRAISEWLQNHGGEIFWLAIIGLAVFLLIWFGRMGLDHLRRRQASQTAPDPRPESPGVPKIRAASLDGSDLLSAAEALAAQGRHVDAIHILLLAALDRLSPAQGRLPPSWTGRDVLRRAPMSGTMRAAFSTLLDKAEQTHFGGRAADAEDYAACRALFDAFGTAR